MKGWKRLKPSKKSDAHESLKTDTYQGVLKLCRIGIFFYRFNSDVSLSLFSIQEIPSNLNLLKAMNTAYKLLIFNLFLIFSANAQAPYKFSWQAVIRDQANNLIVNRPVGLRFIIIQGSASGNIVYGETQRITTNSSGLATAEIGGGTVLFNSIANINWANGPYFLKTEIDPSGGFSYSINGTTQMLSVPYALYAENCPNACKDCYSTLIKTNNLPAGRFCRNGGFRIEFGLDINKNLQLDPNEVNNALTKYVCNGINGRGIVSTIDNGNGTFTFTYSDGTTFTTSDLRGPQGPQGIQGPVGAAGVGILSTSDNGNGTFTINYSDGSSFTSANLTGPQGAVGPQGIQGTQGPAGANGNGIISTINNGNGTYTFNYSDGSSFTTANLTGPQGPQGNIGPQGPAGNNGQNGIGITNSYVQGDSLFVVLSNGQILNTGYVRGPQGSAAPAQTLSQNGSNLTLSNGGGTVSINDADSNPTNEIELPSIPGTSGQVLTANGSGGVYWNSASGSAAGAVMYIYNDQQCPSGWTKQEINVQIWGVTPVDACWTTQPCMVMYIYNGQSCPTGWIFHDISAAVINESTIPVDACIKY